MEYRCVSADCHIDLCWMPHDLFVSNATPAMKQRMPYVEDGPRGPHWVTREGLEFGYANGAGSPGAIGAGGNSQYVAGADHRLDRIASTGLYSDGGRGVFRPTTPELRLEDQDRDGIQAEVMYSLIHTGNRMKDRDAASELYRIYNDWLASFCRHAPSRFIGLASIPSYNIDATVAEARRAAKLGLKGYDVSASWDMTPLWHPEWDPLWKTAAEFGLPVHFHTIGPRPDAPVDKTLASEYKQAARASRSASTRLSMANVLASVIHSGALERYPNLKVVLGESSIGWIPYLLERMDYEYDDRFRKSIPYMKLKPSDYWRRQCKATFQNDRAGIKLLDELGAETIMWGSDYPHPDGVFPDSQEHISRQFGHLPDAVRRRIICDNARELYHLQ
jgi:predicted TIM-barrel fold metal-dependent hydrolase